VNHLNHPLHQAAKVLNTSLTGISALLGVSKSAVSQWKVVGRNVPILHCLAIEKATKGMVSRQELRPDDWHLLWPELIKSTKPKKATKNDITAPLDKETTP